MAINTSRDVGAVPIACRATPSKFMRFSGVKEGSSISGLYRDLCDEGMSLNSRLQVVGWSNQDSLPRPHAHGFLRDHG